MNPIRPGPKAKPVDAAAGGAWVGGVGLLAERRQGLLGRNALAKVLVSEKSGARVVKVSWTKLFGGADDDRAFA